MSKRALIAAALALIAIVCGSYFTLQYKCSLPPSDTPPTATFDLRVAEQNKIEGNYRNNDDWRHSFWCDTKIGEFSIAAFNLLLVIFTGGLWWSTNRLWSVTKTLADADRPHMIVNMFKVSGLRHPASFAAAPMLVTGRGFNALDEFFSLPLCIPHRTESASRRTISAVRCRAFPGASSFVRRYSDHSALESKAPAGWRPEYKGHKAWPKAARERFEKRWPIGTTPRTVYALALYFGHRRSDVARVKWTDLEVGAGNVIQKKTGKALWIPMLRPLAEALEATPRRDEYVVLTVHGRPFSIKALGMRMQRWTAAAGLPAGHTLHGLRKTLGKMLAEAGATTRELMAVLGHDDIAHAELYSREAEQRRLASAGMAKLASFGEPGA